MTRGFRMFFHEIRTSKDRRSRKWTLMSFNYVLAGVHWTLADTYVRTTRYCNKYRRRSMCYVRTKYRNMIHTR